MLTGDPYKFGFLIEKVDDWVYEPYVNGLMFLFLNGQGYPDTLTTTTLSAELPELLHDDSPLVSPREDKELYNMESEERFELLARLTYPESIEKKSDLSFVVPFHEINDSGYAVFTISDGSDVIVSVGKWDGGRLLQIDEREVSGREYKNVIAGLKRFYNEISGDKKKSAAKVKLRKVVK